MTAFPSAQGLPHEGTWLMHKEIITSIKVFLAYEKIVDGPCSPLMEIHSLS